MNHINDLQTTTSTNTTHRASILLTPVNSNQLDSLLLNYDYDKCTFMVNGFRQGFRLGFLGQRTAQSSPNLKLALDHPLIVHNTLQKEIISHRIAGPFHSLPFPNLKLSPLGVRTGST